MLRWNSSSFYPVIESLVLELVGLICYGESIGSTIVNSLVRWQIKHRWKITFCAAIHDLTHNFKTKQHNIPIIQSNSQTPASSSIDLCFAFLPSSFCLSPDLHVIRSLQPIKSHKFSGRAQDSQMQSLLLKGYQDLGNVSDWFNQISISAWPIRSTTQVWIVNTSSLWNFGACSSDVITLGNQLWCRKVSLFFSG